MGRGGEGERGRRLDMFVYLDLYTTLILIFMTRAFFFMTGLLLCIYIGAIT